MAAVEGDYSVVTHKSDERNAFGDTRCHGERLKRWRLRPGPGDAKRCLPRRHAGESAEDEVDAPGRAWRRTRRPCGIRPPHRRAWGRWAAPSPSRCAQGRIPTATVVSQRGTGMTLGRRALRPAAGGRRQDAGRITRRRATHRDKHCRGVRRTFRRLPTASLDTPLPRPTARHSPRCGPTKTGVFSPL